MAAALPALAPAGGPGAPLTESQSRIAALAQSLAAMDSTTKSACRTCTGLSHRSRHLDSLTSPASETLAHGARARGIRGGRLGRHTHSWLGADVPRRS